MGATVMRMLQSTRGRLTLLRGVLAAVWLGSAAVAHFVLDQFDGYDEALVRPGDALLVARSTSLRKR